MSLISWPFTRVSSWNMMDEFNSTMRQMERYMREMERDRNDLGSRMNMQLPVNREAEAWHVGNPIVTDSQGNRKLSLRFDLHQFKPEEIQLKTKDGQLELHAKHDETAENSTVHREYHRLYTLPEGVKLEELKSVLSREGVLTVEAPLPAAESVEGGERTLPIEHLECA